MNEHLVPIGDLIDTVRHRVIDPQTMQIVATLRQQMLQQLQKADPSEAAHIRDNYLQKLQSILDERSPSTCSDC